MVPPNVAPPGGEATRPARVGLRCGRPRTQPDRCSYNGFGRSINKPITAPWPVFSPASCRAVVRGGGGHGKSPGRIVGTTARSSSGLQEPSRSWISNADIPDRGRRQQGCLCDLVLPPNLPLETPQDYSYRIVPKSAAGELLASRHPMKAKLQLPA